MAPRQKRVSIKDIAELAGVSHPTVSRALRGQGRMSEDTRNRILLLADEMGYTPSLVARGLVTQKSHCVGLIVPTFVDPFHSEVAQGVEQVALAHKYSLFLASTDVDIEREMAVVRSFDGRQVDGIITSSSLIGNHYVNVIEELGIPVVLVNSHETGNQVHEVRHDDYGGGCQILEHLLERGYKRIAYLGNALGGLSNSERYRAWVDLLTHADLQPKLAYNAPTATFQDGFDGAKTILERAENIWQACPDAIYCYNDRMAIGALAALRERGLSVPDDIAITGFDDLGIVQYLEIPLTTFRQPRREIGVTAMEILLRLMDSSSVDETIERTTIMPGELIIRQTT